MVVDFARGFMEVRGTVAKALCKVVPPSDMPGGAPEGLDGFVGHLLIQHRNIVENMLSIPILVGLHSSHGEQMPCHVR